MDIWYKGMQKVKDNATKDAWDKRRRQGPHYTF